MKTHDQTVSDTASREVVSTRVFNTPRETVFHAWTNPDILAQWWGPSGFRNTFKIFEPRPGGTWEFTMHGPDGTDYPNKSVFVEIEAPARIVLNHVSDPKFQITATFEDQGGKTRLTFHMLFESARTCEALKPIVIPANEQNFDRLEAELAKLSSSN